MILLSVCLLWPGRREGTKRKPDRMLRAEVSLLELGRP